MNAFAPLSVAAPAKINLYLHVTGKRDDGFHLLDSLVAFAAVHDTVHVSSAANLSLTVEGPFGDGLPTSSENLVLRAAENLRQRAGIPHGASITLIKRLPVASGIGGGSADAAATLTGLIRHWNLHPGQHDLSGLALDLGADVPVCLFGQAAFMGGIGEQLEPVPELPAVPMVLINPGVAVSTPAIFKARTMPFSPMRRFDQPPETVQELAALLSSDRGNDLTEAAVQTQPVIGDVLSAIAGSPACLLARMSGSGATCFGFYETHAQARAAAAAIASARPDWWVQATHLVSNCRSLQPE